jgi:hypothetical protein
MSTHPVVGPSWIKGNTDGVAAASTERPARSLRHPRRPGDLTATHRDIAGKYRNIPALLSSRSMEACNSHGLWQAERRRSGGIAANHSSGTCFASTASNISAPFRVSCAIFRMLGLLRTACLPASMARSTSSRVSFEPGGHLVEADERVRIGVAEREVLGGDGHVLAIPSDEGTTQLEHLFP